MSEPSCPSASKNLAYPTPTTPLRPSSPPVDRNTSLLAAPVKKYPCRRRYLTDRGVVYWQGQMGKTELQDPFLSSLVASDGRQLTDIVASLKERSVGGQEGMRNIPSQPHNTAAQQECPPLPRSSGDPDDNSAARRPGLQVNGVLPFFFKVGTASLTLYYLPLSTTRPCPHSAIGRSPGRYLREVNLLRLRVGRIERSERRLQQQLHVKSEIIKDTKVLAEEAQIALIVAEETISNLEASLRDARGEADRYQGWWLTEYHSLKVALNRLPLQEREEFKDIASSSKGRFVTYCSEP